MTRDLLLTLFYHISLWWNQIKCLKLFVSDNSKKMNTTYEIIANYSKLYDIICRTSEYEGSNQSSRTKMCVLNLNDPFFSLSGLFPLFVEYLPYVPGILAHQALVLAHALTYSRALSRTVFAGALMYLPWFGPYFFDISDKFWRAY